MTNQIEQLNNARNTSENQGSAVAIEEGNLAVALEGDALCVVEPPACGADIPDTQGVARPADEGTNAEQIDPAPGFTVRSGIAFDLDATGPLPDLSEDAATLAAARRLREGRLGYRALKRAFDVAFSACVLVCLSWLFLAIAVAVKLDDPRGPVLFRQRRVGRAGADGEPATFDMYKFRSMVPDAESRLAELKAMNEKTGPVFKMRDDPRVTRVGRVLRKTSLVPVTIGILGDGEPTKSLSHPANSPLVLCRADATWNFAASLATFASVRFLSGVVSRDPRRFHPGIRLYLAPCFFRPIPRSRRDVFSFFISILKVVRNNGRGECCCGIA